jgi:hypothetical protein
MSLLRLLIMRGCETSFWISFGLALSIKSTRQQPLRK